MLPIINLTPPIISGSTSFLALIFLFNLDSIYTDINPNPTFQTCKMAINFSLSSNFDGVIAIGGGSVMDTAKVVMASMGTKISNVSELLKIEISYKNKVNR